VEFMVDKWALGKGFSEYFGFLCQFSFHRLFYIHHLSSGSCTIGQLVADVPSKLSLIPPQETKKKNNNKLNNMRVRNEYHAKIPVFLQACKTSKRMWPLIGLADIKI
jgi:hypothetical protein